MPVNYGRYVLRNDTLIRDISAKQQQRETMTHCQVIVMQF